MKVVLVQCPAFGVDRPPISLGYLASFARKHGFIVEALDLNVDFYSHVREEDKKLWEFKYVFEWVNDNVFLKDNFMPEAYFENWTKQVLALNPDVIGFSVQASSLKTAIRLAKAIKNSAPDKIIIFGGPLSSSYSNVEHVYYLLRIENTYGIKIIYAVVLGEGEETLLEILNRIRNKDSLVGCLGTVIRDKDMIVNNGSRPLIKDLDTIPFPEFTGFTDMYQYKNRVPILGSRGCIHKCVFCDDTLMWRYYRFRSAENILEEMKLRKKQGVEFLEFNDLLINGNLRQLSRLCDLIINEKLDISWGGSAAIKKDMDLDFLRKLKMAGCAYLNYGIESASPLILREMGKNFSIEEAKRIIEDTYRAGINVCTNWIVGFPTENNDDFKDTLNFIEDNIKYLKNNIMVNSFILKGNSLLFKDKEKFGIVSDQGDNWYSYGGLNTVEERKRRYDEFIEFISKLGDSPAHETFQK